MKALVPVSMVMGAALFVGGLSFRRLSAGVPDRDFVQVFGTIAGLFGAMLLFFSVRSYWTDPARKALVPLSLVVATSLVAFGILAFFRPWAMDANLTHAVSLVAVVLGGALTMASRAYFQYSFGWMTVAVLAMLAGIEVLPPTIFWLLLMLSGPGLQRRFGRTSLVP